MTLRSYDNNIHIHSSNIFNDIILPVERKQIQMNFIELETSEGQRIDINPFKIEYLWADRDYTYIKFISGDQLRSKANITELKEKIKRLS